MSEPSELIVNCPACQRPLRVPSSAIGLRGHCSHCQVVFVLPRLPDGSAGTPELIKRMPRSLVIPAVGLLLLGAAGLLVNGYLTGLFLLKPGSDVEYARTQLTQLRAMRSLSQGSKPDPDWEHAPRAAVSGVAGAAFTARLAEELSDDPVAAAWAPSMLPVQASFIGVNALIFLGGLCIVRGRFFPYALLSCVIAILNVNHLCCVPGLVVGVWGILMLVRDENRPHFQ